MFKPQKMCSKARGASPIFLSIRRCIGTLALLAAIQAQPVQAADRCTPVNYQCEAARSPVVAEAGQATVMLTIPGVSSCTGTLLNNARGDGRPYILTARHYLGSSASPAEAAAEMLIYYGYEADCSSGETTFKAVTTGAISRAGYQDGWLVEALDPVPLGIAARLAGISIAKREGAGAFGIHQSGPKAYIETQTQGLTRMFVLLGLVQSLIDALLVDLKRGTTLPGSSGSALFDDAGRVIGTMTSGADCALSGTSMRYQDINALWSGAGTPGTSLKSWLDPDGLGLAEMQGASADALAQAAQPPEWSTVHPDDPVLTQAGGGGALGRSALAALFIFMLMKSSLSRRKVKQ